MVRGAKDLTTLVEQTLSAHTNIAAGDELPIIGSLAQRIGIS
jgi:hypothetical protein